MPGVIPPTPPATPGGLTDDERRDRLVQMKRLALGLLIWVAILYVVAWHYERFTGAPSWIGYVRATAEAAVVGGLADWFAVTALFRHPLGIPIPHTAIIAARKDRIGRNLGAFVQHHFLSREVVARKLTEMHPAERVAAWLSEPANARRLTRQGKTGVAPLVGRVLAVVAEERQHQVLLDSALRMIADAVEENRDQIRERIAAESPWWVPNRLDDIVYAKLMAGLEHTITAVRDDPNHPLRMRFDVAFQNLTEKLQAEPDAAPRSLEDSPSAFERTVTGLGESVRDNPELLTEIDGAICDGVLLVVEQYRGEVAHLIAHTVESWDPQATSERIELAVGRDLQFIRINGTIVGGLAGLIIHALSVG